MMIKEIMTTINYLWRVIAIRICFAFFGLGSLLLGYIILPLIRLGTRSSEQKDLNAQYAVSITFRLFVILMESLGIVKFSFKNFELLQDGKRHLIVSNHPTLIDYVVIVSRLKNCYTLLKADASKNFFMKKIIQTMGYISNADPGKAFERINTILDQGHNLLLFPEGTRTRSNQALKLHRGAANIALRTHTSIRIIRINCSSGFLTKQCRWYTVPRKKVQFDVEVGEVVDISDFPSGNGSTALAARELTKQLTRKLEGYCGND